MSPERHTILSRNLAAMSSKDKHRAHIPSRLRHTELQPLTTENLAQGRRPSTPRFYQPRSATTTTPLSSITSASPSGSGPQYSPGNHGPRAALQAVQPSRISNPVAGPRRHSLIVSPGLMNRFESVSLTSPLVLESPSGLDTYRKSIAAESRELLLTGLKDSELARVARVGNVASRRKSMPHQNLVTW